MKPLFPSLCLGALIVASVQADLDLSEIEVSCSLDEVALDETLRTVFRELDVSFILVDTEIPEVDVSMTLTDTSLDVMLDGVLPPQGLRWEVNGDVVLIHSQDTPELRALRAEVTALRASVEALTRSRPGMSTRTLTMSPGDSVTVNGVVLDLNGFDFDTAQFSLSCPERSNFSHILHLQPGDRVISDGVLVELNSDHDYANEVMVRIEVPVPLTEDLWPKRFL